MINAFIKSLSFCDFVSFIRFQMLIFFILILSGSSYTQEKLSLQQAIELALKNNYDIILAQNELEIAGNNNTAGNAGMLPVLSAEISNSTNISNSRLEFFDREPRESPNARTDNLSAAALLNWKIFDGMNMFITRKKLGELENMGETELKMTIENTVAGVIEKYYEIVQLEKSILVTQEAILLSLERKKLAEKRLEIGSGSQLEINQAIVDMNADSLVLLQQEMLIKSSKSHLNTMLAIDPAKDFKVDPVISFNTNLDYSTLLKLAEAQNPDLLLEKINTRISELDLAAYKSQRFPIVALNGGYTFTQSKAEVGIYSLRSQYGPEFGLTASMTLFNGLYTERNIKNARIRVESGRISVDKVMAAVKQSLYDMYLQYKSGLGMIRLETDNLTTARENVSIALEKYRLGMMNDIDLRTIQQKQVNAENSLLQAQFQVKIAETELMRICGKITIN